MSLEHTITFAAVARLLNDLNVADSDRRRVFDLLYTQIKACLEEFQCCSERQSQRLKPFPDIGCYAQILSFGPEM